MKLRQDLLYVIVYGPGFGESIVIRAPEGEWLVVDGCTANGQSPPAALIAEHDASWSCAVLTHPHLDHALGLDAVLERPGSGPIGCADPRLRAPEAWQSSQDADRQLREGTVEHVLAVIHDRWTSDPSCRWEMKRGDRKEIGNLRVTVLHPDYVVLADPPADPNRLSTALLVAWHDVRLLLGSDVVAEDWGEISTVFPGLSEHETLKFPHHGSEGAVHSSWGEGPKERLWIMTPWNRGKKLPRYEDGHGLAWALQHIDEIHLTGLPVKHQLQAKVPYRTTRQALLSGQNPTAESRMLGGVRFELAAEPPGVADACFVAAGFEPNGSLADLQHGPGALVVRENRAAE